MVDEIIEQDELPEAPPPHPDKHTTVTGKVIDSDGVTWVNCGIHAVLVGYVGAPPIFIQDGTRVPTSFNTFSDAQGNINVVLPANDTMIPPRTRWRLTFIPLASSPASTFDIALSGVTMNVTTTITQNIRPPRFKLNGVNYGYADSEVSPKPVAGTPSTSYLNTTTGNLRIWNGTAFVDVAQGALPTNAVQLLPHVNDGDLQLTKSFILQGAILLRNNAYGVGLTAQDVGLVLGWNASSANGETDFINSNGGAGGGFNWYNEPPNTHVDGTTPKSMYLDYLNNLHVSGAVLSGGAAQQIPANTDLNSWVVNNGWFTGDASLLNAPAVTNKTIVLVEVIRGGGPTYIQKYYPVIDAANSTNFYMRVYNGAWTPWVHFVGV